MPHQKCILVIGGDERYLSMIPLLMEQAAEMYVIGYNEVEFNYEGLHRLSSLADVPFHQVDIIILPVSGSSLDGNIILSYPHGTCILTKQMVQSTPHHCVIVSGVGNAYLTEICTEVRRRFVALFERDDIAIYNSIPTAEGTLQLAMEHTKHTIHGSSVLVIGFGRIGITIARLFDQVGANVKVAARKQADFARITEMQLQAIHMDDLHKNMDANIFINTVPHPLITENIISNMNKTALIIDLASDPGGCDFVAAKAFGVKAIHALGLPGKVAPVTAGEIIASTIVDVMSEKLTNK